MPIFDREFIDVDVYFLSQNTQDHMVRDINWNVFDIFLNKNHSYGAAVSIGRTLYEDFMPLSIYGRLGLERGAYEVRVEAPVQTYQTTAKKKETFVSFAPGLGLKLSVNDHFFFKLGYTYVFPHSISLTTHGGDSTNNFVSSEQRIKLSVAYQF